jgi:hypothetical protein
MREVDIRLPASLPSDRLSELVERSIAAEGLTIARKGSLATYPGSIHWHLKQGKRSGTLELTWWPEGRRCWFKVAEGRQGDWIDPAISRLQARLEKIS